MAIFQPFAGVRYDLDRVDLADVVAPPYDVIDAAGRARLEARSPYNAVRVELADDGRATSATRRSIADSRLGWPRASCAATPSPASTSTGWVGTTTQGRAHQTTGVLGALEVSTPDQGQVLPHERTMGKPKDDRLSLLRATRANLSAVWRLVVGERLVRPARRLPGRHWPAARTRTACITGCGGSPSLPPWPRSPTPSARPRW